MTMREEFMAWAEDVRPACTYADHSFPAYNKAQMLACWEAASAGKAELLEALQKLVTLAETSDDCLYGTISTRFLREIALPAIAKHGGPQ